jgi:hypothetical protein
MRFRRSVHSLVVPLILTLFVAGLLGLYRPGAWSQSPVSPLAPSPLPTRLHGSGALVSPLDEAPGQPLVTQRWFESPIWFSPLPWAAVGLVLFGLLGWAVYILVSKLGLPNG